MLQETLIILGVLSNNANLEAVTDYSRVPLQVQPQRGYGCYRRNPVGVSKSFPQGSRETRQPWAVIRNRFAVSLSQHLHSISALGGLAVRRAFHDMLTVLI